MATPLLPFTPPARDDDFIENWDEYWYEGAMNDGVMVSSGFNGLARNVFDDPHVLHDAAEKLKWICHAEANAIFNAARQGVRLKGATIYVTKFPCLGCCNAILQAGISRIYTQDDKYWNDDPADADHTRKRSLLHQSKIEVDAPFHPDFAPRRRPTKKASSGASSAVTPPAVAEPIALTDLATKKPRKGAKAAPPRPEDFGLFGSTGKKPG